ncbi:hypothetical protein V5P93_000148 [Actinokineospora auranticolor]|uniref:hypothetical protein n=1 Tax=Actinokineospora auranticolor TaxID=155976 RepID=UPI000CEBF924|nr:hypothetical protein [Actinokineospora auranticolor]
MPKASTALGTIARALAEAARGSKALLAAQPHAASARSTGTDTAGAVAPPVADVATGGQVTR